VVMLLRESDNQRLMKGLSLCYVGVQLVYGLNDLRRDARTE